MTAVASAVTAVVLFFYQHLHPVEAVTLLRQMQLDSPAIEYVHYRDIDETFSLFSWDYSIRLCVEAIEHGALVDPCGPFIGCCGKVVTHFSCILVWNNRSVVANGRPTVVDFYAEWCENCKEMAPTLRQLEGRYKDKVYLMAFLYRPRHERHLVSFGLLASFCKLGMTQRPQISHTHSLLGALSNGLLLIISAR